MRKPLTDEQKAKRKAYMKAYGIANREKIAAVHRSWCLANPGKKAAMSKAWYEGNKDKTIQRSRAWAEANPEKRADIGRNWRETNTERASGNTKRWKNDNRGRVNNLNATRKIAQHQATPEWADEFILDEAYELAQLRTKATGVTHHVDHIVPIRSKRVCGLHCEFNIRVIPGKENVAKGNRHWPDMPC